MSPELFVIKHLIRLGLLLVGGAIIAAAWLTPDEMWTKRYWLNRLRGYSGDVEIHTAQMGGVERGRYLLIGVAMVVLGLAWPWVLDWMGAGSQPVKVK